jgi:hypothetical protein
MGEIRKPRKAKTDTADTARRHHLELLKELVHSTGGSIQACARALKETDDYTAGLPHASSSTSPNVRREKRSTQSSRTGRASKG